jgi:hypothetical protein
MPVFHLLNNFRLNPEKQRVSQDGPESRQGCFAGLLTQFCAYGYMAYPSFHAFFNTN